MWPSFVPGVAVGNTCWLRNLMFCVDVLSFFLVLNETFGRSPKLCASDDSTSISSTYSPDCLCSSASDISNFP